MAIRNIVVYAVRVFFLQIAIFALSWGLFGAYGATKKSGPGG